LNSSSFSDLLDFLSKNDGFNFAIIDGLHQPLADLNSVRLLLPYLLVDGFIFVEDIQDNWYSKVSWKIFNLLSPSSLKISYQSTSTGSKIFIVNRVA
jgi:hypothetical protein